MGLCKAASELGLKVLFSGEGKDELLYGYVTFDSSQKLVKKAKTRDEAISHLYHGAGIKNLALINRLTNGLVAEKEASQPWIWLKKYADQPLDLLQLVFSQKYLDGGFASGILEEHFSRRENHSMLIWQLFALELWHECFADFSRRHQAIV